jgi:hypothetical protein
MDWEEKVDPKGTTYYVNHATQATQWDRPADMADALVDLIADATDDDDADFEVADSAWEEKVDPTGRYVHSHSVAPPAN